MSSGTKMTVDEIIKSYDSVKTIIRNGGITATGGEPLLQLDFLTELFKKASERGIHTCLDTSGITFKAKWLENPENEEAARELARYDRLLEYTDLVMLDIKHIDTTGHKKLTGHNNDGILAFLSYLSDWRGKGGKAVEIWIRHVVVPGITLNDKYLDELGFELGKYRIKALDVLPYHDMAKTKYENLGIPYPLKDVEPATKEEAMHAREIIIGGMKRRVSMLRKQS